MNREIKFRGKSSEYNKWIYGSFIDNTQCDFDCYISCDNGNLIKVDRDTICQYTGLKDKNGVLIYESDILKSEGLYRFVYNEVFYDQEYGCFEGKPISSDYWKRIRAEEFYKFEVIGNIYENKELLK